MACTTMPFPVGVISEFLTSMVLLRMITFSRRSLGFIRFDVDVGIAWPASLARSHKAIVFEE